MSFGYLPLCRAFPPVLFIISAGECCHIPTCSYKTGGEICRDYVPGKACQGKCSGNSGECPADDGSCRKLLYLRSLLLPL